MGPARINQDLDLNGRQIHAQHMIARNKAREVIKKLPDRLIANRMKK